MTVTHAVDTAARIVKPGQLRAVDYLRVSTEQQLKGYGIVYSGKATKRHIEAKGWAHVGTYADEGFSGSLEAHERPDVKALMTAARQNPRPFDVVTVNEERAIGRAGRAFWPWVWELEDLGVFVAIVDGDYDNTTVDGRKRMRDAQARAEDEREVIRKRTQGGLQEKAEEGGYTGGYVPYGYRVHNQGIKGESRLVVDECTDREGCAETHESAVLRRARTLFVEHRNWRKTAALLNAEGLVTRSGRRWTEGNLRNIMTSDPVLETRQIFRQLSKAKLDRDGNPLYGKQAVINLPSVFTEEERDALRAALEIRPRPKTPGQGRTYILSGRLISPCGSRYTGWTRQGGRTPLYRCSGRRSEFKSDPRCSCPALMAEAVEAKVWGEFCHALGDTERLRQIAENWAGVSEGQANVHENRFADLDKQIKTLRQTIKVTTSVAIAQALARDLPEGDTTAEAVAATLPLNQDLASLERLRATAVEWKAEAESAEVRVKDLQALAEAAHGRLERLSASSKIRLLTLLDTTVTVTGPPPPWRSGKPCGLAAWFRDRERPVPHLTDEAWAAVADLFPPSRKLDPRSLVEGFLCKARTGVPWEQLHEQYGPAATMRTYWTRWKGDDGIWEQAMGRLADAEGDAPYVPGGAPPVSIHTWVIPELLLATEQHLLAAARTRGSAGRRSPGPRPPHTPG